MQYSFVINMQNTTTTCSKYMDVILLRKISNYHHIKNTIVIMHTSINQEW